MKSFNQYLNEAVEPTAEDIKLVMSSIESAFLSKFPNCYLSVTESKSLGHSIGVSFGLILNKAELPSGIRDNDPVQHQFIIHINKNGFEAVPLQGSIWINPPAGSYLAMGRIKTPFRKTSGDAKKIIKAFETFVPRLKQLVKDNEANIYGRQKYKDVYFK